MQHSLIAFYLGGFPDSFTGFKSADIVHRSYFFSLRASSPLGSRARFSGAIGEASRERFGAGVREGELATITEEISFPPRKPQGGKGWIEFHRTLTGFSIKPLKALEPFEFNMTDKQLDACISEVLSKFQTASGVQFQLKEQQVTAVKNLLSNHDVLAVLPTGYGKSLIFQSFVVAKELLENAKACVVVICPLTSIIQDQIAEAKSLAITCVSLQDIEEIKESTFQLVFSSAERVMEKDFKNLLKDNSCLLHKSICGIVVDESHTVETWTGRRFVCISVIYIDRYSLVLRSETGRRQSRPSLNFFS